MNNAEVAEGAKELEELYQPHVITGLIPTQVPQE